MASLTKLVFNFQRALNYAPIPNRSSIGAISNPLLRYHYGYGLFSPFTSQSNDFQFGGIDLSNQESKRRLINRLLYRSKQRGLPELDLVLGKWVEENINSLSENQIKDLTHVLDLESPDLWKWLSVQEQPPESVSSNPVFHAVRKTVMKNLDRHSAPETRATPGQPWVRGWDDLKKSQVLNTIAGNQ